jgi:hypothetical protein
LLSYTKPRRARITTADAAGGNYDSMTIADIAPYSVAEPN